MDGVATIAPGRLSPNRPNKPPKRKTLTTATRHTNKNYRPPVLAALAARVPSPYVEEAELHFDALLGRLHVRGVVGVGLFLYLWGAGSGSGIDPPEWSIVILWGGVYVWDREREGGADRPE